MAIPSHPTASYTRAEANPHLTMTSFQAVAESSEVSPEPPLLQAEQSELPQLLPIRLVLQTPHQLCCPSLDTLQGLDVFLVLKGPKLNTVLKVWAQQG